MNRTVVVLGFAVLLSAALLWAGGVALVSWRDWPDTRQAVERSRDAGKADCAATYSDPEAKERCTALHDVKFVADLNIARATRGLIGGGPLIVLLLAALAVRRSARSIPPAPSRS
ncbi:hypothetical protein T8K17_13465 [Thalassobaculum sp. OXR-137]|uniref:hypothetical protein n=1 Tax=Thalassobaculum sp. OXR-137 TaxID=3100173 RepID=UPI002AC8BF01|nr:hypothetical protein [Thalassobaculum sp. OXR-137]WPZ32250.1 hypothetical protein T8K17_13465 [Thalassobaculum sp. OXR-137]